MISRYEESRILVIIGAAASIGIWQQSVAAGFSALLILLLWNSR